MGYIVGANIEGEPQRVQQREGRTVFSNRGEAEQFQQDLRRAGFDRVDIIDVGASTDEEYYADRVTAPASKPDIYGGRTREVRERFFQRQEELSQARQPTTKEEFQQSLFTRQKAVSSFGVSLYKRGEVGPFLYEKPTSRPAPEFGEGYEIKSKTISPKGTILFSNIPGEAKLSRYENEQFNLYITGRQSYKDYTTKTREEYLRVNKIYPLAVTKTKNKPFFTSVQIRGETLFQQSGRESKDILGVFRATGKGTAGVALLGVGGVIEGTYNFFGYTKKHPYESAAVATAIFGPNILRKFGVVSKVVGRARLARDLFIGAEALRYTKERGAMLQLRERPEEKISGLGIVAGEVGSSYILYKGIEKTPPIVSRWARNVRAEGVTMDLKESLSAKYEGALIQQVRGDIAPIIKDVSVELRVEPLLGLRGKSFRAAYPYQFQEASVGIVEPIFGKPKYFTFEELGKAPKDFVAEYSIERRGAYSPLSQPSFIPLKPILPSTQRAQIISTTKKGFVLTTASKLSKYNKPILDFRVSEYYGGTRVMQSSLLKVKFSAIELSTGREIATIKDRGWRKKTKPTPYSVAGGFPKQPKYGIDLYQRVSATIQPGLGKLFAKYKAQTGGQTFIQTFKLPPGYNQPLIIRDIKVRPKPITKSQPIISTPTSKGMREIVLPSGLILLQKVETKTEKVQKQRTQTLRIRTQKLGQRQKTEQMFKPLFKQRQRTEQMFKPFVMQERRAATRQRRKQKQFKISRYRVATSFATFRQQSSSAVATRQEAIFKTPQSFKPLRKQKEGQRFATMRITGRTSLSSLDLDLRNPTELIKKITKEPPGKIPPPIIPLNFGWPKGKRRKIRQRGSIFSPFNPKYVSSVGAVVFNIKGKRPKRELYETGLTVRPLEI